MFTAVIIAYAIQWILTATLGTPYPAIMMPEFKGSGGYQDGKIYVKRMDAVFVTAEGQSVSFTPHQLLADFPGSHQDLIANYFLSPLPERATPDPTRSIVGDIAHRIFPGLRAGSLRRAAPENIRSLRSWAIYRARQLLPGRTVERVEFRWYQDTFQNVSGRVVMERKADGAFVLPLQEP